MHAIATWSWAGAAFSFVFYNFMCGVYLLYGLQQYWRRRHHTMIQKRGYEAVIVFLSGLWIILVIKYGCFFLNEVEGRKKTVEGHF